MSGQSREELGLLQQKICAPLFSATCLLPKKLVRRAAEARTQLGSTQLRGSWSTSLPAGSAGTAFSPLHDRIKDLKVDMQFASGMGGAFRGRPVGAEGDFRQELPQQILRQKILFLSS